MDRSRAVEDWEEGLDGEVRAKAIRRSPLQGGERKRSLDRRVDLFVCLYPASYMSHSCTAVVPRYAAWGMKVGDVRPVCARMTELADAGVLSVPKPADTSYDVRLPEGTATFSEGVWSVNSLFKYRSHSTSSSSSRTRDDFLWECSRRGLIKRKNRFSDKERASVSVVPIPVNWDGMVYEIERDGAPFKELAESLDVILDERGYGKVRTELECSKCSRTYKVGSHTVDECREAIVMDVMGL